ncbi:hypothetical protein LCGC14_2841510, partial [marine sediment metagenome]
PLVEGAGRAAAKVQGKKGSRQGREDVRKENTERAKSREALKALDESGGLRATEGELSRNERLLGKEANARADATANAKRAENKRHRNNRATQKRYVDEKFQGNVPPEMQSQVLAEARDAVSSGSRIAFLRGEDGLIIIQPHALRNAAKPGSLSGGTPGLRIVDNGQQWRMTTLDDIQDLKGIGLGRDLLEATMAEARAHNRALVSDSVVSEQAFKQLKNFPEAKVNPKATLADGEWTTGTGEAVITFPALPDGLTSTFIRTAAKAGATVKQRIANNDGLFRFLRTPGKDELAIVGKEVGENSHLKGQLLEKVYEDYQAAVTPLKDGVRKWTNKAHQTWLKGNKRTLESILSPEEFQRVNGPNPGSLRQLTEEFANHNSNAAKVLAPFFRETPEGVLATL